MYVLKHALQLVRAVFFFLRDDKHTTSRCFSTEAQFLIFSAVHNQMHIIWCSYFQICSAPRRISQITAIGIFQTILFYNGFTAGWLSSVCLAFRLSYTQLLEYDFLNCIFYVVKKPKVDLMWNKSPEWHFRATAQLQTRCAGCHDSLSMVRSGSTRGILEPSAVFDRKYNLHLWLVYSSQKIKGREKKRNRGEEG